MYHFRGDCHSAMHYLLKETRMVNQEWMVQRHRQNCAQDTKRRQNKTKTQHRKLKRCATPTQQKKTQTNEEEPRCLRKISSLFHKRQLLCYSESSNKSSQ